MSYNYNTDPWDSNYDQGPPSMPAAPSSTSPGAYAYEGYANPMSQFPVTQEPQPAGMALADYDESGYQDQQQQQQQGSKQQDQPPPQSYCSRFLRAHLPLYAPAADCLLACSRLPAVEKVLSRVNRDLLVSKMFYFFFYSAFGSLFPLMGVYFKQQGMNPFQVGILTGVRPFIEIFSAPFWSSLAERFNKCKFLLLFSLVSWILFTYSLAHIRPPASACIAFNDTDYVLYVPYSGNDLSNFEYTHEGQSEEATGAAIEAAKTNASSEEFIMTRMPSGRAGREPTKISHNGLTSREMSEEVLQSDESETDQGRRRRRRKRQIAASYLDEGQVFDNDDGGTGTHGADLDLDLENDFEDERLRGLRFRRSNSEAGDQDENELSQTGGESTNEGEAGEEQNETAETETSAATTTSSTTTTTTEDSGPVMERDELQPNRTKKIYKQRHKTPPTHVVGVSPITVEYAVNYNREKHGQFVTPMFSTIVYKLDDIKEVFFLLLLLISLGEFFSAPALTLADSATLRYLGENTDLYGRQRMFGSLSWAVTLLLVGMALDSSTSIADHPCGPHHRERSYTVCFVIFSLLMAFAFLTATQFRFDDDDNNNNNNKSKQNNGQLTSPSQLKTYATGEGVITTTTSQSGVQQQHQQQPDVDQLYAATQPRSIFNTAPPVNAPPGQHGPGGAQKFEFLDKWRSAVFAQRTRDLPEWVNVFRQFSSSPIQLLYLFITWFLGCGVGLVFTFLFWHLQDVGGTPTLFGICSVINHISEILAYFFSFNFIKRFGHTRVLSVGLGCNLIRFIYVAFLTNPYYALPFELVQGITHAACFAACCSYISHHSKPELKNSSQGVMQGLHHGIGRACGALLGGYMINSIGSRASFCIYGLLSGCVLAGFLYVRKKTPELADEEVGVDDSEALGGYGAPQGVPSAIPGKMTSTQDSTITSNRDQSMGSGYDTSAINNGSYATGTSQQGQGIPGIDYQW